MAEQTRERPILFSGPMVRALLEGRKTQTRRVVKPEPVYYRDPMTYVGWTFPKRRGEGSLLWPNARAQILVHCPYGQPGDRLWVREAWRTVPEADSIPPRDLMNVEAYTHYEADGDEPGMGKLRPGMFMPRWASRITLEITGVRVERLQDISEADAMAEGAPPSHHAIDAISREYGYPDFPRSWYGQLWDTINGAGAWGKNPWVWVVEFRKL